MWKSHAFQQVFWGFEHSEGTRIFHFSTKKEYQNGDKLLVTETKMQLPFSAVFDEKVGKNFLSVTFETLRAESTQKFLFKTPKGLFVSSFFKWKYW